MNVPNIKLADGMEMPQLGLGLYQVHDQKALKLAVKTAIKAGYRLFDSAQAYGNEAILAEALKESKVKRSEVFITTKIAVSNFGYNKTISTTQQSLKKLQTEYIDLMLLHFPVTLLRKKSWQALEKLKKDGLLKSIGVSNYTIRHLEEIKDYASEMPVVNQVELHVFLQQPELIEYCNKENIQVEAYSPLARASAMDDPIVKAIAKKYSKSYAQIMLRFLIQLGLIVIPKSVTPKRIEDNINIFDFKLSNEDMKLLKGLDRNYRTCWNPTLVP